MNSKCLTAECDKLGKRSEHVTFMSCILAKLAPRHTCQRYQSFTVTFNAKLWMWYWYNRRVSLLFSINHQSTTRAHFNGQVQWQPGWSGTIMSNYSGFCCSKRWWKRRQL